MSSIPSPSIALLAAWRSRLLLGPSSEMQADAAEDGNRRGRQDEAIVDDRSDLTFFKAGNGAETFPRESLAYATASGADKVIQITSSICRCGFAIALSRL